MLFSGGPFLLSQHLDYYQNYQKTQVTCLFWFNFGCFICQHTLIVARYTFRLEHVARPWLRFLCVPCVCVCTCGHIQTLKPHRNPIISFPSPWVDHLCTVEHCEIPGIIYDPTFSRLPRFLTASGLFAILSWFGCPHPHPTSQSPSLWSRIFSILS